MTETDDPQLPQGSFATGKWVFPKRPLKDQTAGVHPKMSNPSLATAKDYGALTALGDLHRTPGSGVVHGYSRGQQDTVALCRSGPSIRWFWRSQSSPHHKQPGQQRRPRRPKLPLMVGIHYWPEHHWMSLDVIGRWWLALSRKHGQGTTSQKLLQNQLPLQSLHRVPHRIPGINLVHGNPHPCNPSPLFYQATSLPPWTVHKTCWAVGHNIFTGKLWPCFAILFNQILVLAWPLMHHLSSVVWLWREMGPGVILIMLQKTDWNWIFQISFCFWWSWMSVESYDRGCLCFRRTKFSGCRVRPGDLPPPSCPDIQDLYSYNITTTSPKRLASGRGCWFVKPNTQLASYT